MQKKLRGELRKAVRTALLLMAISQLPATMFGVAQAAEQTNTKNYQIKSGALAQSLNAFASLAGVSISLPPALVDGKKNVAIQGHYTVKQALDALLKGTGLDAVETTQGVYHLQQTAAAKNQLDIETQSEANTSNSKGVNELPLANDMLPEVQVLDTSLKNSYEKKLPVSIGTRTDASLMDIPQTIDVVPSESIKDRNALSIKEALAYTPGVTTSTGEGIREQFLIRGFSAIADTFVDGMRDGRFTFRDTFSLEQVEVVKGPAGVLYGRGSAGGLINLVSKRATDDAFANLGTFYGSYDAKRLTLDINQPLTDSVLFRVNAMVDDSDSFRDNVEIKKSGLAVASTIIFNENITLDLNAQHLVDRRVFDAGIPGIFGKPADVPISTYYGARDPQRQDSGSTIDNSLSADLKVSLNENVTLRNTTRISYLESERFQTTINRLLLNTPIPRLTLARSNFASTQYDLTNRFEVMVKQNWLGIQHDWLVGTELSWEDRDTISRGGNLPAAFNIAVFNPVSRDVPNVGSGIRRDGVFKNRTSSLYIQDMMRFSPKWTGLIGFRNDWLDRNFENRSGSDFGRKDNFFSPRAGLVFQPNESSSYYVSASRSYQPGGATGGIDPGNAIDPPEVTTNYEIGAKQTFNEGKLQLGISLFNTIRENVPTRDPGNPLNNLYVGEVVSKGLELSTVGDLGNGLSLQGGITLLDARVTKSNDTISPAITPALPPTQLEGQRAANSPEMTATLWAMKRLTSQWRIGLGVRHSALSFTSTTNAVELPAYTVFDAGVYREEGPWALSLNIRNLTDKIYYESSTNDLGILPGAPRILNFNANYQF